MNYHPAFSVLLWAASAAAAPLAVSGLRTEYLTNPLSVESPAPRFTWVLQSQENGQKQTAYRILAASSRDRLAANQADLWDSGRVASSETVNIPYAGKPLISRQRCFWKVQVWDKDQKPSAWSAEAEWSMGLLRAEDWRAQWISYPDPSPVHNSRKDLQLPPARAYRGSFSVSKTIRRAVLYGSALGIFDPYLNGRRVAETMFSPGWSDYHQRAYYRAWDVTSAVSSGANTLGAIVADGWYAGYLGYGLLVGYGPNRTGRNFYGKTPALLLQLEIEFADGTRQTVATGDGWHQLPAPSLEADFLMGETYDARLQLDWPVRAATDKDPWATAIPAASMAPIPAPYHDMAGDKTVDLAFRKPPKLQAYTGP
ncbi:MAG: alpha-L-rhamnosidase N-terminal domain-containing protein, partial [Acidobacteria bacterium]|nr:alpha-L-rhamnosidase N-terminal domain-containing protein [Acidobacteriota bacterium]